MSKKKRGLAPGSLVYTGDSSNDSIYIHVATFDSNSLKVKKYEGSNPELSVRQGPNEKVTWYDIRGVHDINIIKYFGTQFNIHPLVLEDIANVYQRAKFEEFEDGIFITLKALSFDKEQLKTTTEQVSIYFRDNELISFQEDETDLFEAVRKRLDNQNSKLRNRKTDYLAYALIDCLVDNYFDVLDSIEEVVEALEEELIQKEDTEQKSTIHKLKKELLIIKKSINPLRELIGRFAKSDSPLIYDSTEVYIRDLQDHTIQLIDITETFRDVLNGLYDLLMTNVSFKMNQVMQVLTIIATIFIPLTFLAGVYGMNFKNIPELQWEYGYRLFWAVIVLTTSGLIWFFKKKKWF